MFKRRKKDLEIEVWKDVPGYERRYQISNLGRVRRKKKRLGKKVWGKRKPTQYYWVIVHQCRNHNGMIVTLKNKEGIKSTRQVHKLVANAFIPGEGKLSFKNGDEQDCRRINIVREGMKLCSKLTEKQIHKIWDTFCGEEPSYGTMAKLAKEFAVHSKTILDYRRKIPEDWREERFGSSIEGDECNGED